MKYLLLVLMLAGCASKPLIDPKSSTHPENYYADEMECARIAEDVNYGKEMAVKGAIQGTGSAALAYAIANSTSQNSGTAGLAGLLTGLVVGAAEGAWTVNQRREKILRTCLGGRGYKVLE
jgi:hypothetical protein